MPDAAVLLFSEVIAAWALAVYAVRDPVNDADDLAELADRFGSPRRWRVLVFARALLPMLTLVVATKGWRVLWVALPLSVTAALLPLVRVSIDARRCAELEIGTVTSVAALLAFFIRSLRLHLDRGVGLPFTSSRIAAVFLTAAIVLFVVNGGTYVVRGILKKSAI